MFQQDSSLCLGTDKSLLIIILTKNLQLMNLEDSINNQVIIFDGMAVLNQIKKTPEILTFRDLADAFSKVLHEGKRSNEIRVIN